MALDRPPKLEDGWKESQSPELIKWEKKGENVCGVLARIDSVQVNGKRVPQFLLTLGDRQFKFLGTFDLMQKINRSHIGCQLRITYLGDDENIRGGPSNTPMKIFSVQYKGTPTPPEANAHGVVVTDEDVPF